MKIVSTASKTGAQIVLYSGEAALDMIFYCDFVTGAGYEIPGVIGVTVTSTAINPYKTVSYYGQPKKVYEILHAEVTFLTNDATISAQSNCLHEYSHAMGWFGHSVSSAHDIMLMHNPGTTYTTLQTKDINHLKQIYLIR